jgi:hypothetical protein
MKLNLIIAAVCGFLICGQLVELSQPADHPCHERDCFVCPCKTDESCFSSKSAPHINELSTDLIISISDQPTNKSPEMLRSIRAPPWEKEIKPHV